jgi:hypothetical protein
VLPLSVCAAQALKDLLKKALRQATACVRNNYGGNNGNFGLLATELRAPAAAHKKVAAQGLNNMVGVGLTMEGIYTVRHATASLVE